VLLLSALAADYRDISSHQTQRSPSGAATLRDLGAAAEPAGRLRLEVRRTAPVERPALLRHLIIEDLDVILRRRGNPGRSFCDCDLDSLGTLQLLIALEADTGIRLPAGDVTTVRALADKLG
jgi:acyl carrier protein